MYYPNMFGGTRARGPRPVNQTQQAAPGLKFQAKSSAPGNGGSKDVGMRELSSHGQKYLQPNSQTAKLKRSRIKFINSDAAGTGSA